MEISYVTHEKCSKCFVKGIDLKQKEHEQQRMDQHMLVSLCYKLQVYLVPSSNFVAASRLVFWCTVRGKEVNNEGKIFRIN